MKNEIIEIKENKETVQNKIRNIKKLLTTKDITLSFVHKSNATTTLYYEHLNTCIVFKLLFDKFTVSLFNLDGK